MATIRQQKAIKILMDSGGKSVSGAMKKAGYSEATAKTPSKLTGSKTFKDLFEEYIPDDLLAKKHKELLTVPIKVKKVKENGKMVTYEYTDVHALKAGLDLAYKVKGRYAPTRINQSVKTGLENLDDEELGFLLAEEHQAIERFEKYGA
jgi:hypothetical protein